MLFSTKSEKQLLKEVEAQGLPKSYWGLVWQQFKLNRMGLWSLRILYVLIFIAIFGDFIANEKPIICKVEDKWCVPIVHKYFVNLGWASWDDIYVKQNWTEYDYQFSIHPLIPFTASRTDLYQSNVNPMGRQRVESLRWRHWLGTDKLGRDLLAGLITGTRISMLVGIVSMSIAGFIGIFLGSMAGFFGDKRFRISRSSLFMNLIGAFFGIFYAFGTRSFVFGEASKSGSLGIELFKSILLFGLILALFNGLAFLLKKITITKTQPFAKKITIPLDLIIMRLIEVFNSIPALLFLLSIVAILEQKSIFFTMAIIGLIRWTSIARFIRAEMLRIRDLEYIEAARALGFSQFQIIWRHAIPNALPPVLITFAFGIAGAILLEAALSFLGIGVAESEITWGKLLSEARMDFKVWWMAIFPGLAIFVTVTIFNLIGEGLTEALNPKLKQ